MHHNRTLTALSLISIALMAFHLTGDFVLGLDKGAASPLAAIILIVCIVGTLVFGGTQWGLPPLYSLGYGLSHTTFRMDGVRVARDTIGRNDSVHVRVQATNTGTRAGDALVQLYIRQDYTLPTRPVKELKDFQRVALMPGETKTVTMPLTPAKPGHVGVNKRFVVDPGLIKVMVGSSSRDRDLANATVFVR